MAIAKVKRVVSRVKTVNAKADPVVDNALVSASSSKYTPVIVILAFIVSACFGAWLHSLAC